MGRLGLYIIVVLILSVIITSLVYLAYYTGVKNNTGVNNQVRTSSTVPASNTTVVIPPALPSNASSITINASLQSIKPVKRLFIIGVSNDYKFILFNETLFYGENTYEIIINHWREFKENILGEIKKYESSGAHITSYEIKPLNNTYAVNVLFRVDNRIWNSGGEVTMDLLWFLNNWGLDLINNHFNESNHSLKWSGYLMGVFTIIDIELPEQPGIYKAWGTPYGHCHGHIWWPTG